MHAPIYRCRFNWAAVSALLKSSVLARSLFLGQRARSGACGPQSRVLLSRWCMSKDPAGFTPLGLARSRAPFRHWRAPVSGCARSGVTSQPHVVIAADNSGRHAWRSTLQLPSQRNHAWRSGRAISCCPSGVLSVFPGRTTK